jgi:ABC-type Co2+ transport system permease subunit
MKALAYHQPQTKPGNTPGFFISTHNQQTIPPMIPIPIIIRIFRKPLTWLRHKRPRARQVVLLPVAAAFMALSSCNEETTKPVPYVTVTDTKPVGEGLTVIGFAIVGATVVVVLGRLLR